MTAIHTLNGIVFDALVTPARFITEAIACLQANLWWWSTTGRWRPGRIVSFSCCAPSMTSTRWWRRCSAAITPSDGGTWEAGWSAVLVLNLSQQAALSTASGKLLVVVLSYFNNGRRWKKYNLSFVSWWRWYKHLNLAGPVHFAWYCPLPEQGSWVRFSRKSTVSISRAVACTWSRPSSSASRRV